MIIPSLDLIKGQVIRLYQGNYNKQIAYNFDPFSYILYYIKQGAKILHLVDLDGAKNPKKKQILILKKIINSTKIEIQVGGGIRNKFDIIELLNSGAKRIVIGSIVIKKPNIVKKWLIEFGSDVLVLSLDINIHSNNTKEVMINGWQKKTGITIEEVISNFTPFGLKHVLCTDISYDGTLKGSNIKLYQELVLRFPYILFQASGGVNSLNDILALRNYGIINIIIGRAFLENKFTFLEAVKCWQKE